MKTNHETALITGGTKGLGLATAKLLAERGTERILLSYRSDEAGARAAVEGIRALGPECEALACDLSEDGAATRLWDWVAELTPSLDLYVHNAAATAFKDLLGIQPHHVDKTFNITVKSLIAGAQRAVALMPAGGAIVTVSGMDTLKAVPRHGLLGAAKSALETLTSYLAHELAGKGIRVNGVNPGFLRTDSTRKYLGPAFEAVNAAFARASPLRREPSLEEIAEAILFVASPRASWIVGQTIRVDGGQDFALPPMG